jgi:hypothetical protein
MTLDFDNEVQFLSQLRDEFERGGIRQYLTIEGIEGVVSRFGGLELFSEALEQAGYHPRTVRRHIRHLGDLMKTKAVVDHQRNESTTATRIDELRRTFTA